MPWYTAELSAEQWLRRKCKRKYKNTQLESDKLLLKEQRNKYNNLHKSTKKDYIKNKIENAQSSKDLSNICDKLLNREQRSVLSTYDCATSLANAFVDYFKNKIELIRSRLEESLKTSTDQSPSTAPIFHGLSLEQFRVVSESDARKVITSSPTESCVLDSIPTWLLKQCLDQVAPVLTVIVNTSLSCADFIPELKRAFVTPLIKKLIMDCEIFKNLFEFFEIFQSAYRQLHSTEAALLRVQNDILQAADSEGGVILVLLDLSAAYDTTDH